jgi:hypothetical protein
MRSFYILWLLLGISLYSCQNQDNSPQNRQTDITRIEVRAPSLLVKYRSPQYSFSGMMQTDYFRKEITNRDTILIIDSLLSHITNVIPDEKQEYIAGVILYYKNNQQDSIRFGYRGIYYKETLYTYPANAELVRIVSTVLPSINRYALLLGLDPDDKEMARKLQEAITQTVGNN